MKIRIGHLSTFYHTAIILMAQPELLGKRSIETDWKLFGTGPSIVDAFERGEIDVAYIGLPPAVIGIEHGISIKCIAGGHIEGTVVSGKEQYTGHPDIHDLGEILKQFLGHKIGVPGNGSTHDVILKECLEQGGLRKDIEVVNFRWADEIIEAVVKEEVAAAVGTPALAVAVRRYAGGKILYPPSKLWPNNPSYGILVSTDILDTESNMIEEFLIAHEEATSLLRQKPEETARIISDYTGIIDKEFVLETINVSPKYCAYIADEYIASTMKFVSVLKRLGYIRREIGSDEVFDVSLIRKIHPSPHHYGYTHAE